MMFHEEAVRVCLDRLITPVGRFKNMTEVTKIPGVGRTFSKDLARIQVHSIEDLAGQDPEVLFDRLRQANLAQDHDTSKNYLYVLRMATYYANGGREPELLRWSSWSDRAILERRGPSTFQRRPPLHSKKRDFRGTVPTEIVL